MKQLLIRSRFACIPLLIVSAFLAVPLTSFASDAWQAVGDTTGFSNGGAQDISLVFPTGSSTPYVAYEDAGYSNKVVVMKYNGTSWELVGPAGISTSWVTNPSLAFTSSGMPYLAYGDSDNSSKMVVRKYNGSSWEVVGTAGFSAGATSDSSLAIDSTGVPYVSYRDVSNGQKVTVMKFNGTSWELVGTAGFSASTVINTTIAFDNADVPYVSYHNLASHRVTVMKFNGTSWELVGTEGFSAGWPASISLVFPTGSSTPYVAYQDASLSSKAVVMKFNGTSWGAVGTAGFTPAEGYSTSLAFSSTGIPYVGFSDIGPSRTTVMKYNGSSWGVVGEQDFSAGVPSSISIALNNSNVPYIVYGDATYSKAVAMAYLPVPTYTLSFDEQGGSTVSDILSVEEGDSVTLPAGPTRSGYSFQNWNTVADGTGTVYAVGSTYTMPGSNAALYATWTAVRRSSSQLVTAQVRNLLGMGKVSSAQSLMQQFPGVFQNHVAASTTVSTTRNLELGMIGEDVRSLQKLLNANGFILAQTGPGSPGNETTKFGALTQTSLARYQASQGIAPAAGYFGPLTRANFKFKGFSGLWW